MPMYFPPVDPNPTLEAEGAVVVSTPGGLAKSPTTNTPLPDPNTAPDGEGRIIVSTGSGLARSAQSTPIVPDAPDIGAGVLVLRAAGGGLVRAGLLSVVPDQDQGFNVNECLSGLGSVRRLVAFGGEVTGDVSLELGGADFVQFVLVGNVTFALADGVAPAYGTCLRMFLKQDAVGGHTVAWPNRVRWSGGTAPVITPTPGAVSIVELVSIQDPHSGVWNLYGRAFLDYTSL